MRTELYHHLCILLFELDEGNFHLRLQKFMSLLVSHLEFYTYFQHIYVPRTKYWAGCYRIRKYVNTNMFVESFHRLLKVVYLEGKNNRRLDRLVNILCRVARDKAFEKFKKIHKGKLTHTRQLQQ